MQVMQQIGNDLSAEISGVASIREDLNTVSCLQLLMTVITFESYESRHVNINRPISTGRFEAWELLGAWPLSGPFWPFQAGPGTSGVFCAFGCFWDIGHVGPFQAGQDTSGVFYSEQTGQPARQALLFALPSLLC